MNYKMKNFFQVTDCQQFELLLHCNTLKMFICNIGNKSTHIPLMIAIQL